MNDASFLRIMTTQMQQLIEQTAYYRPVVEQMIELLPPDDAALDGLISEVVASNDLKAFMYVVTAAAAIERRMDAGHLRHGAMMFPEHRWMGKVAIRMEGDMPAHLIYAIRHTRLNPECEAAALHLIAAWCQEHRQGVLPEEVLPLGRAAARRLKPNCSEKPDIEVFSFLRTLAVVTQDNGLTELLRQRYSKIADANWQIISAKAPAFSREVIAAYKEPVMNLVSDKPNKAIAQGFTLRRSLSRVGRNDRCPCGNGKKYKRCCLEKDHERLLHSSDVAGVTHEELFTKIEEHLTAERLDNTEPYEVAKLNPQKVPAALVDAYFLRLATFNLLERAAEALEILGWSDTLKEAWGHVMFGAARLGRQDIAQQLMRLREPQGFTESELDFSYRLLLAGDDPARSLQLIEEESRKVLKTEDMEDSLGLAYSVAVSKFPALGILLYRGVFPLVPPERAAKSFEQLLIARDRLNLPPDDPFSDLIDQRLAENKDESKDATAMREAQRKLDGKVQEVQQLKESLARLQKDISRRETKSQTFSKPVVAQPMVTAAPANESALREMRGKVETLREALKERHTERNDLRRELQKTQADLEAIRQPQVASSNVQEPDDTHTEDNFLLPQETDVSQPVRLIEFPRQFHQRLGEFPKNVARGTLTMLGRLAAGEPAAFVGAVRLKACPTITRQRIGIDFRLLFRILTDRIQVVDLIPRQDLERKIKTLI
jgi:hypothetical protein